MSDPTVINEPSNEARQHQRPASKNVTVYSSESDDDDDDDDDDADDADELTEPSPAEQGDKKSAGVLGTVDEEADEASTLTETQMSQSQAQRSLPLVSGSSIRTKERVRT